MADGADVPLLATQIAPDDITELIPARSSAPSSAPLVAAVPHFLERFFKEHSWMVVYPEQETGAAVPDLLTGDNTQASRTWKIVSAIKRAVLSFQQR